MRAAVATAGIVMVALGAAPAPAPAAEPGPDRPCNSIEPTYDRQNVALPDKNTRYLGLPAPIPPGGYVEITGEFPRGRYFSLQTVNQTTATIMSVADSEIVPDPGSSNPYTPSARRHVKKRSYTIKLIEGRIPAEGPAPNTLYNTSADGLRGNGVAYRLYLADSDVAPYGGADFPEFTAVTKDGQRFPFPECPDTLDTSSLSDTIDAQDAPAPNFVGLLAYDPPVWRKNFSLVGAAVTTFTDFRPVDPVTQEKLTDAAQGVPVDGLGASADNAYLYTYGSREYGRVLHIRARLPTTPKTFAGQRIMGTGQLRYWSLCSAQPTPAVPTWDCLFDEQVPLDAHRDYSIVVSSPRDRPEKARPECGVTWLAWGPDTRNLLVMRNQLASPAFQQSIQNATFGTEKETLGAYHPRTAYYPSASDFDRSIKCRPPAAGPGAGRSTGGPRHPKLRLRLRRARSGAVPVRVVGRDRRLVRAAIFVLDGRRIKRDRTRPMAVRLSRHRVAGRRKHRLRVRLSLDDGRRVMLRRHFQRRR